VLCRDAQGHDETARGVELQNFLTSRLGVAVVWLVVSFAATWLAALPLGPGFLALTVGVLVGFAAATLAYRCAAHYQPTDDNPGHTHPFG
jgi:hypothetical protein